MMSFSGREEGTSNHFILFLDLSCDGGWLRPYFFIRTITHMHLECTSVNSAVRNMHSEKQNLLIEEKWVRKSPFHVPSIEEPIWECLSGLEAIYNTWGMLGQYLETDRWLQLDSQVRSSCGIQGDDEIGKLISVSNVKYKKWINNIKKIQ